MRFRLIFTEAFSKALDRLDHSVRLRLPKIFEKIKQNPKAAKELHGKWNYYRIRFLNYRILYTLDEKEQTVLMLEIGKRDSVYD